MKKVKAAFAGKSKKSKYPTYYEDNGVAAGDASSYWNSTPTVKEGKDEARRRYEEASGSSDIATSSYSQSNRTDNASASRDFGGYGQSNRRDDDGDVDLAMRLSKMEFEESQRRRQQEFEAHTRRQSEQPVSMGSRDQVQPRDPFSSSSGTFWEADEKNSSSKQSWQAPNSQPIVRAENRREPFHSSSSSQAAPWPAAGMNVNGSAAVPVGGKTMGKSVSTPVGLPRVEEKGFESMLSRVGELSELEQCLAVDTKKRAVLRNGFANMYALSYAGDCAVASVCMAQLAKGFLTYGGIDWAYVQQKPDVTLERKALFKYVYENASVNPDLRNSFLPEAQKVAPGIKDPTECVRSYAISKARDNRPMTVNDLVAGAFRDNYVLAVVRDNDINGLVGHSVVAPPGAQKVFYVLARDENRVDLLEPPSDPTNEREISGGSGGLFADAPGYLSDSLRSLYRAAAGVQGSLAGAWVEASSGGWGSDDPFAQNSKPKNKNPFIDEDEKEKVPRKPSLNQLAGAGGAGGVRSNSVGGGAGSGVACAPGLSQPPGLGMALGPVGMELVGTGAVVSGVMGGMGGMGGGVQGMGVGMGGMGGMGGVGGGVYGGRMGVNPQYAMMIQQQNQMGGMGGMGGSGGAYGGGYGARW